MPPKAKMTLHEFARSLYDRHSTFKFVCWNPTKPIKDTWTHTPVSEYFKCSTEEVDNWRLPWRTKRNAHLERFGVVPKEIELLILEKTLRDHFGEPE